ncbi:MAG: zf-HC2 domain-containing protein [Oscillospiraceae bacterium]|nr:zf-HC2 domain-containing protein [Oscillospiraceae bacterium]
MKLPCNLIRDLLPLYGEGLCSPETTDAVQEHLAVCSECREALKNLQLPAPLPPEPALPLRTLKRELARRWFLSVLTAVLLVLALAVTAAAWMTRRTPVPFSPELIQTELQSDGSVLATITVPNSGFRLQRTRVEKNACFLEIWTYPLAPRSSGQQFTLSPTEAASPLYYTDYQGEDHLLWGEADGGVQTLPRLVLSYYLLLDLGILLLSALLLFLLRRQKPRRVPAHMLLFSGCYLIAHLCIKGFSGLSMDAGRDFLFILSAAALLSGSALAAGRLRQLSR